MLSMVLLLFSHIMCAVMWGCLAYINENKTERNLSIFGLILCGLCTIGDIIMLLAI